MARIAVVAHHPSIPFPCEARTSKWQIDAQAAILRIYLEQAGSDAPKNQAFLPILPDDP
jgi:hypothetical protein